MKSLTLTVASMLFASICVAQPKAQDENTITLDQLGWLTAECHEKNGSLSFKASISSSELDGVRQVTEATLGGKLYETIRPEAENITQPTVGLATVQGNDLKIFLRYDNGLVWPDELTLKLRYNGDRYVGSAHIRGDEGVYLDEKSIDFECSVGNGRFPALRTPGFNPTLLGFKSKWD
jgi:hypothetical protein